jgi:hypothetical protein
MRRWLVPASFLIALVPASAALAQNKDCPPGSWFCEDAQVTPPPETDDQPDDSTATTPQDAPAPKKHHKKQQPAQAPSQQPAPGGATQVQTSGGVEIQAQGPVVIYTQNGQQVVTNGPAAPAAPAAPAKPVAKKKPWREHFGLNLRAEGAGFASANGDTVGMGGLGLSFRWRPAPAFALDVGLDVMGGNDYYSQQRIESALSLTGILFFNPKSIFQIYALGGFHVSHAEIGGSTWNNTFDYYDPSTSRDYIGIHGGLGFELRVAKHLGLDLDGVALLRTGLGNGSPEFVNTATGETSDTSGAGMARAGVTFWW